MLCTHGEMVGDIRQRTVKSRCHRITCKDYERKVGCYGDTRNPYKRMWSDGLHNREQVKYEKVWNMEWCGVE